MDQARKLAQTLDLSLRVGEVLLSNGAGAADVTATMRVIAQAYGVRNPHVDVTFTQLAMSAATGGDDPPLIQIRGVTKREIDYEDLTRTRITPGLSPLAQTVLSAQALRGTGPGPVLGPWRTRTRTRLTRSSRLLLDLVPPGRWFPDFLTPYTSVPGLDSELDAVASTPARRIRAELERSYGPRPPAAWLPRPLGRTRCRSCAVASPSRLTPTRTPSSSNSFRKAASSSTPFVCRCTSTRAAVRSRTVVTTRRIRSGPASNGSPPCRTMLTAVRPWALACSAMRWATSSTVRSDMRLGCDRQL